MTGNVKNNSNTYEEARKQRVLENQKRIEELGILKISKSLADIAKSAKPQRRQPKPRATSIGILEPRRSSRAHTVVSYRDDIDVELPSMRKRSRFNSSWTSYLARPVDEVKCATLEERNTALRSAEKLKSNLQSEYPYFIKSMVRSHVYSCFWLGLPSWFCEDHLPKSDGNTEIVLEDENGAEYEAVYISKRTGLSGGWRAFALDHKLDDGDALVFELIEPTRLKVYIVRAGDDLGKEEMLEDTEADRSSKEMPKETIITTKRKTETKKGGDAVRVSGRKGRSNGSSLENDTLDIGEESKGLKETKTEDKKKPTRISSRKRSSRL
ncbi:TF-B3 domain-containing protein [Heracleum sosnowskyi]|uniref:TF-B3 domain-containing protein n=1 Tax=Heracleum sosnowskyi TaxID=360622 RepID=A0AAD8IJB6_9APIA|nr:TF-B3 domain-containing protein [Heracleum sosnowskyi]